MSLLVSAIISEAQALLNDASGDIYTTNSLLPFVKKALRELEELFILNELPYAHRTYTETIEVGDTTFDTPPADLILPVKLFERAPGQTDDDWVPMTEKVWNPNQARSDSLNFWAWLQGVEFLGANTDREVKMRYDSSFPVIVDGTSAVPIVNSQTFLSARVAAIAAITIGSNPERGSALVSDSKDALERIIGAGVKQRQNLPVRRIGYPSRRRLGGRVLV